MEKDTKKTTAKPTENVVLNIHQAIIAVMRDVGVIGKNRKNESQNYKFRGIDDLYNELHSLFAKHGIYCTSEIVDFKKEEKTNTKGNLLFYINNIVRYRFIASDGSSVSTEVQGEAMDSGDKASNKSMSSAHKVALLQMFMIETEGDNDTENQTHEIKGNTERKFVAEEWLKKAFEAIQKKHDEGTEYATKEEFITKVQESYNISWSEFGKINEFYNSLASNEPTQQVESEKTTEG